MMADRRTDQGLDQETDQAAKPGAIRILLLEDNPGDVYLLQQTLARAPIEFGVEAVARLQEALERLNGGGIDVVLSDLTVPDSFGIATFHRLAAHPSRTPIVVLSGLDDEALALKTVEEGAQDYLVKGRFDQALLVRTIRYAIKRAEADRAVQQERNLLRSVIDNLPDSIYVKDNKGRYLLDNTAHMRQIGARSMEEVVGKSTADFFPPEVARTFMADDQRVLSTGQSVINRHESLEGRDARRWFSTTKVPLRDAEGRVVGLVGIGRDITARKQAEEQLRNYMEELRVKNAEMEDDLNMAREVQQAYLPQQYPCFPRKVPAGESWLRFYSKYLPTATLGGDFFHVLPVSDTQAGVFICDVMGHGVRAALVTAIERALVEELAELASEPGAFLTQMNTSLLSILRRTRSPMFASAFYMLADVETGELKYANAGHPRPVHLRREAGEVALLDGTGSRPGPALGVFDDSHYETHRRALAVRDLVILYTDGLYEVEGLNGEFYDQSLLLSTLGHYFSSSPEDIFERTLEEIRRFSASGGFIDDVCMVGMEVQHLGALP